MAQHGPTWPNMVQHCPSNVGSLAANLRFMGNLGRFVPVRMRPFARRLRKAALNALGEPHVSFLATAADTTGLETKTVHTNGLETKAVHTTGLETETVLRLLYGAGFGEHTRLAANAALDGSHIRETADFRHLLGTLDRQVSRSPVNIRFQAEDLRWVTIEGLSPVCQR
jgi:hypothetical protein